MKKMDKRKKVRWIAALVVLLLLLVLYVPRPLFLKGQQVDTILYRAPEWDTLHVYYPIQGVEQELPQDALESILKKPGLFPIFCPSKWRNPFPREP